MAGKQVCLLMAIVVIAGISSICSAQRAHIVGGTTGWTIPPSTTFYTTWASRETFQVGDVLVFNFPTNQHTVAEVNQANLNSCNTANTIGAVHTTGPTNITLTAGTHHYICTIGTHCTGGQRLTVVATGPSAATPAAEPTPAGGAATPATGPATPGGGADSPAGGSTVPAASTPSGSADVPAGSPPAGSAASTGVSVLSLVSVAAAALMF